MISASEVGASIAAPIPCTKRAPIMNPADCATPAPNDPKPNSISEMLNIRFLPYASPNPQLISINPPKAIR